MKSLVYSLHFLRNNFFLYICINPQGIGAKVDVNGSPQYKVHNSKGNTFYIKYQKGEHNNDFISI